MEGLPAAIPSAQSAATGASAPAAIETAAAPSAVVAKSSELFSKYPGLEATSTLENLREFIGDCERCKLAPRRTNLVFGVGNPDAQLMFIAEPPGAHQNPPANP